MLVVDRRRNNVHRGVTFSNCFVWFTELSRWEEATVRIIHFLPTIGMLAGMSLDDAHAQPAWPQAPRVAPAVVMPVPAVDSPAYRQFLNSESSYKTYSRLMPSRAFS